MAIRFALWGEDEDLEGAVIPHLREDGRGNVILYIINKDGLHDGPGADLFTLTSDGRIIAHKNVNPKYGFDLDEEGRIVVED